MHIKSKQKPSPATVEVINTSTKHHLLLHNQHQVQYKLTPFLHYYSYESTIDKPYSTKERKKKVVRKSIGSTTSIAIYLSINDHNPSKTQDIFIHHNSYICSRVLSLGFNLCNYPQVCNIFLKKIQKENVQEQTFRNSSTSSNGQNCNNLVPVDLDQSTYSFV